MNEPSPAVEIFRMLRAAGCNTKNEHDLQMGMIAYNAALLAWDRRNARQRAGRPSEKSHTGRNDPCPCGSGRKYKKCCLDKNRTYSAISHLRAPLEFGSESLPRLWDERAVANDCEMLGQIMDRDPAFVKMGFSKEKIASFIDTVVQKDPSFLDGAKEAVDRNIDDLAARYVRESGEGNVAKGMKENVLAAIPRAQTKDEMRALATGFCLALMDDASMDADATMDADASLLNVILFRRALFDVIQGADVFGKILDELGSDTEEVRRLIAERDPSLGEKIESFMESLSPSDKETLQATFEKNRDALWNTISSGEFPVPMPFATHLTLFVRFSFLAENAESRSPEAFSELMGAFSDELIEEDYVLYAQMLNRWLKDQKNRTDHVAKAVEMMLGFCAIRSIGEFAPKLMFDCFRQGSYNPFDEEERLFIDRFIESCDQELLADYSAWLTSKGFTGMANRLLVSRHDYANTKSHELLRVQKSSVG